MEDKIDADRRRFLGAAVMIKQTDSPTPTPTDANQTMVSVIPKCRRCVRPIVRAPLG